MNGFSNFRKLSGNRRRSRWNVLGLMLAGALSAGLILVSSVSASHPTFRVVPSGADNITTFATLQAAVTAAASGGTIIIDAETPGATVNKSLLIKGGFGFVTPDTAPPVVPFLGGTTGVTLADGSTGTVIDGVTFAAPSAGGSAPDTGIFSNPTVGVNNVLIEGCTFINVQRGVMITGSATDYTIKANKIFLSNPATSTQIGVIVIDGPLGTAIVNNTIFGLSTAPVPSAVFGVVSQATAVATDSTTVSKNRIVAQTGSAIALFPSAVVGLDNTSVVGNDLTGSAFTSGNFAAEPGAFAVDIKAGSVTNTTPPDDFDTIAGAGSVTNLQVFGNTQDSNPIAFPTITTLTPSSVGSGSGDTTVVVDGTNYDATSAIRIESRNVELPTTFNSTTQLQATIPSDLLTDVGFLFITVINKGSNVCSVPKVFAITSGGGGGGAFFCTGVSPQAFAQMASPAIITITGNGFDGTGVVKLNGSATGVITIPVNSTTMMADITTAIAGAAVGANFTVSITQGSETCFPGSVRIQVATPTITSVNGDAVAPVEVCAGDVSQTLSIVGTKFASGLNVLYNGNALGGAGFVSSTTASALLDASFLLVPSTGNTLVIRNNGDGGPKDSAAFTLSVIECTPVITSRSPSSVSRTSAARSGMFLSIVATKAHNAAPGLKVVLRKNGAGSEFIFTPNSFSTGAGTQNIGVNIPKTFFTAGLTSIQVRIRNGGGATSAAVGGTAFPNITVNP